MTPGYRRCNDLAGVVCFTRGCEKEGVMHSSAGWNGWSNFRLLLSRVLEGKGPYGRTSTTAHTANTVFWLRVRNVVSPGRGTVSLCQEISSCRVSGLRPWAGQERHVFDFPLSLLWLPLSCLLLLLLKVQLLIDQISGLGTSLPLKHNTEIQSHRGLDSGGGPSWPF